MNIKSSSSDLTVGDPLGSLIAQLRAVPGLCDPECEGRCKRCPLDILNELETAALAAHRVQETQDESIFGSTGLPCHDCRKPHREFSVDSVLWNRVMRPDGHETDREYLCLACFHYHVAKALCAAERVQETLHQVVARWRESARQYRPLECAPISAAKRERTTKWMIYKLCADELAAALSLATRIRQHDEKNEENENA
jgi:hypothetical protein